MEKIERWFFYIAFLNFAKIWKSKIVIMHFIWESYTRNKKNEIKYAKKLVSTFTYISVRESSSVEIIKKRLGINIIHVLDTALI